MEVQSFGVMHILPSESISKITSIKKMHLYSNSQNFKVGNSPNDYFKKTRQCYNIFLHFMILYMRQVWTSGILGHILWPLRIKTDAKRLRKVIVNGYGEWFKQSLALLYCRPLMTPGNLSRRSPVGDAQKKISRAGEIEHTFYKCSISESNSE